MTSTAIVRSGPLVSATGEQPRPRRDEIRAQLDRLLASHLFNQSKHYPNLLRYVVNEALEGRVAQLKERSLGVVVFSRDQDYDTNADPVVRTSACEVRKRIGRYYQEAGHENEIRIDLPPGSYVPEFRLAAEPDSLALQQPPVIAAPVTEPPATDSPHQARRVMPRKWIVAAGVVFVAGFLGAGAAQWRSSPNAVESFWNPVWGNSETVMVALGVPTDNPGQPAGIVDAELGPSFRDVMRTDRVAFSDALTMARLTGFTREFGKKRLDIRRAPSFSLSDLRSAPAVLIGAFNNPWTMRLDMDLRFTYQWDAATRIGRIRDREDPSNHSWVHDPSIPYSKLTQDFAVVSRFLDPLTEKMVVVVGGMGRDATVAAGEFVTDPHYLAMLAARAPKHWDKQNLQVLLSTDIIDGKTGPPRIVATHFW